MRENLVGINETKVDSLTLETIEYAEKLNKIFVRLQELLNATTICFDSAEGIQFRKKMSSQLAFCQIVNQNILSYASDFTKVKYKYKVGTMNISAEIRKND